MPKKTARDRLLAYSIGIGLAVLAVGFAGTWFYLQRAERLSREITYLRIPKVAISRDGHSIAAGVAVRTSAADARWASNHQRALEQVMKQQLMTLDPVRARAPGGLNALQDSLRDASNAALNTTRVQEVLVTDFLVSEGDY